jgi:hypothetical protein
MERALMGKGLPVDTRQNVENTDIMGCKIKAMMRKMTSAQVAPMVVDVVAETRTRGLPQRQRPCLLRRCVGRRSNMHKGI